jgi:2,4'-dihydroxyacetophenone dioxygenase
MAETTDLLVKAERLPWVPQGEGIEFKPLRLNRETGEWVNLLRVRRAGRVSRHRHLGAVEGFLLSGSWHYLEHDWVAHAGDFVFEPPGDVHTLEVVGEETMVTLFSIHGPLEYLDDDGRVVFTETVETKWQRYQEYCAEQGLPVTPIEY